MYVCLCHAVSDQDIRRVVQNGVRTLGQLNETLKIGSCCGTCADFAHECFNAALDEASKLGAGTGHR
jgi:bacterioferritin-associated ferredoxin